jgi:hypothetical protein
MTPNRTAQGDWGAQPQARPSWQGRNATLAATLTEVECVRVVMPEDPLVSELRAAAASLVLAAAAAENKDWPTAEKATLDAQSRGARILRELDLKQVPVPPPVVPKVGGG